MISDKTLKRVRWWVWFSGLVVFFMLVGMCRSVFAYNPAVIDLAYKAGTWEYVTSPTPAKFRYTPALVKQGTATGWGMSKMGAAGFAAFGIGMFYEAAKENPDAFPALAAWLAQYNYVSKDMKFMWPWNQVVPKTGSGFDNCLAKAQAAWNASNPPTDEVACTDTGVAVTQMTVGCGVGSVYSTGITYCDDLPQTYIYWRKWGAYYNGGPTCDCKLIGKTVVYWQPSGNRSTSDYDLVPTDFEISQSSINDKWTVDANRTAKNTLSEDLFQDFEKQARKELTEETGNKADSTTSLKQKVDELLQTGVGSTYITNLSTTNQSNLTQGGDVTTTINNNATNINSGDTVAGSSSTGSEGEEEEDSSVYSPSAPLGPYEKDHDLSTRTQEFWDDLKQTGLVTMITGFSSAVPSGGSCEISFNGGIYGTHTYSFCDWTGIFAVLRAVTLIIAGYIGLRIVTKGGAG